MATNTITKEYSAYGTSLFDTSIKVKMADEYITIFRCGNCWVRNKLVIDDDFYLEVLNTRSGQNIICPYLANMTKDDVNQGYTNCG